MGSVQCGVGTSCPGHAGPPSKENWGTETGLESRLDRLRPGYEDGSVWYPCHGEPPVQGLVYGLTVGYSWHVQSPEQGQVDVRVTHVVALGRVLLALPPGGVVGKGGHDHPAVLLRAALHRHLKEYNTCN